MKAVLPIIIICSLGIAVCLAYIVYLIVKTVRKPARTRRGKRNEFEIEDDTLVIKLGRKRKK